MNHKTMKKLRSQTGASITFALLLFLVCSVLSAVLLAAATTAAGRMSGIAEADQRYYAVTSAAELLKDLIDGKTAKLEKITTGGVKTDTYADGVFTEGVTNYPNVSTVKIDSNTVDESNPVFSSLTADAAYQYYYLNKDSDNQPQPVNLTLTSELKPDPLEVTITKRVDKAGNITFTVGNEYKLELFFSVSVTGPTITETPGTSVTNVASETEYSITTDMTKTETTTLTWKLTGIKTNP